MVKHGLLESRAWQPMHKCLKRTAVAIHYLAGIHPRIASAYLRMFRLTKWLPDGQWKKFVWNSLVSADWPPVELPPARMKLPSGVSVSIIPHLGEFDFASHLYKQISYEPEVALWLSQRSYDAVLEIGANVGFYTLFFSALWPHAKIYAFEPSRTAYLRLQANLELNRCANVFSFNCAVAAASGILDFYEPKDHLTNGSLERNFAAGFSTEVTQTKVLAISGLEIAGLLPGPTRLLLKIDVEGSEPAVVRAIGQTILRHRPDIVLEVLSPTIEELNRVELLREYEYFQLTGQGLVQTDSFQTGPGRDYVLLPRRKHSGAG
jgi:FkbM family methyltransferase